jgi:hypothetical protein
MYADYEALSDVLKSTVKGHKPLHSSRHVFGPDTSASRDEIGAVSSRGEPRWPVEIASAVHHNP